VESYAGALTWLAGNFGMTAMQESNALHDGQAQASATRTLGARRVDTEEAVEDSRQGFGGNADAGVGDFDANCGIIFVRRIEVCP
jgi:hypothetical protein